MAQALDLPPGFAPVALRELGDAFAHARSIAAEAGAGTLVWVRRFDRVELAVVLEPDEPLVRARPALYAVMNAAADALQAHCPPERPLGFAWPDTVLLDGGTLGGARLAWPDGAREEETADWLVAGLVLRLVSPLVRKVLGSGERAAHPLDVAATRGTSLEIEGFEMLDAAQLIGGFARHLMVQVDRWREGGFAPVAEQFLSRLPAQRGVRYGLDANGDLLIGRSAGRIGADERRSLLEALRTPQWLDPETGDPLL